MTNTDIEDISTKAAQWREKIPPTSEKLFSTLRSRNAETNFRMPREEIHDALHSLVDTAVGLSHPTWEPYYPCPSCGSVFLGRCLTLDEMYIHSNGTSRLKFQLAITGTLSWECTECHMPLRVSPTAIALEVFSAQTELEPELKKLFEETRIVNDWERGEPSPLVGGGDAIIETHIQHHTVNVTKDGERIEEQYAERLQTVQQTCGRTGDRIRETIPSPVFRSFQL